MRAALDSMGFSSLSDIDTPESILSKELGRIVESLPPPTYLNESTAFHENPEKSAQKALEKGFLSQGIRIKIESPMNWFKYSSYSRSVRYKLQAWGILDAILGYEFLSKNHEMYIRANSYIMDWVNCFITESQEDDFAWYDMAVGQRATKLAYILRRAIEEDEDIKDIAALIVAAELHIRELMEEDKIAMHSNHGLFQMAGLIALGQSLPFLSSSQAASDFAIEKIKAMLKNHFTEDYLHKEHSPMYHVFMTNYLSLLKSSGFMADSKEFVELARGAIEAAKWFAMPNGMILPFGDTPNIPVEERTNFELNQVNGVTVSPPGLKYFEEGGLVVHSHYGKSKKPQNYLAFNGGFHSRQHKHADDFNIQLFANGDDVLIDPGTFTYQYDLPGRMYIESTRAHNCLEIDGLNYSRYRKDAFGNAVQSVHEIGDCILINAAIHRQRLISSDLPNNQIKTEDAVKVDIHHQRIIAYMPGDFLLVLDRVKSPNRHVYRQWFQINPKLVCDEYGTEVFLTSSKGKPVAKIQFLSPTDSHLKIMTGIEQPKLQGWISHDGHSLEKSHSICLESKGENQIIASVIDLKPSKKATYFFNQGTGGKYFRFVIDRRGSKFELISRTQSNVTELTLVVGDTTHSIALR